MNNQEIDTDINLDYLVQLLRESERAGSLMRKSLSPFKLALGELLFLKRFGDGEKIAHDLANSHHSEESVRSLLQDLSGRGFLEPEGDSNRVYTLSPLGRRTLDSKWDEVERLRRYMSERISPLTLESVVGLLRELNSGYFQGLD